MGLCSFSLMICYMLIDEKRHGSGTLSLDIKIGNLILDWFKSEEG